MPDVEQALRDLEVATAASTQIMLGDPEGARSALRLRAKAVDRLAGLKDILAALPAEERAAAVSRLQSALKKGEEARQRILASKRGLIVEWGRWNHVHLALTPQAPARPRKLDCRG